MQLFIIFFGLPSIGVQVNANIAALVAMTVNLGAYSTEIVRAGTPPTAGRVTLDEVQVPDRRVPKPPSHAGRPCS